MIIGRIIKPHGLAGSLKVHLYSSEFEYDFVLINDKKLEIEKISIGAKSIIKFKNLDTIESVECFAQCDVHVDREELNDNEVYWEDLKGMQIQTPTGEQVSYVTDVNDYGAGLVLDTDLEYMISWEQVEKFDKIRKTIILKQWPL